MASVADPSTNLGRTSPLAKVVSTATTGTGASIGLLVFRLFAGGMMLVHGVPKLLAPGAFIDGLAKMGIPLPEVAGTLQLAGEVGLSILLIFGLGTRIAGGLMALMMLLTWLVAHASQGLIAENGLNGESALQFLAAGLVLAAIGGGRYAIDAILRR